MDIQNVRCLVCEKQYDVKDAEGIAVCSDCGNIFTALLPNKDVCININWTELFLLILWASVMSRHQNSIREPLKSIVERIRRQHPNHYSESQINFL